MENNFMLTDDLLWDYADGFLAGEEKIKVDAYLRQHPEQQARLDQILSEKRAFTGTSLEKPDSGFARQVMAAWATEQTPMKATAKAAAKGTDWVLWGIAAAFGLMIAVPFLLAPEAVPSGLNIQIPEQYIPQLPSFDWAGILNSAVLRNGLLLLLGFMGLKLLDKYLQVRNLHLSGH
jgi:anti-sigma factor RsiW